jgi:hypothetical protein
MPHVAAPTLVHPHQQRFAQAITGALCGEALIFRSWLPVAVAFVLVLLDAASSRISPVAHLFRLFARPPATLEPPAPARFARVLAAAALGLGLAFMVSDLEVAGAVVVGLVTVAALFGAITGFCIGCEIYRAVRRRETAREDVRADLGLEGEGPWIVLLTAPGCGRCEPALVVLRELAGTDDGGRQVVRVDLAERPQAVRLAMDSVPAALAVGPDGRVRAMRAGRLEGGELREVVAAL